MQYKKRIINQETKTHGIQLTFNQLMSLVNDMMNDENLSGPGELLSRLQDLAYMYNLKQYPILHDFPQNNNGRWIVGFLNVELSIIGIYKIQFDIIDKLP